MADDLLDTAKVLKQEFFDDKEWNYDAIDAFAKVMAPTSDESDLFAEFERIQGKYPSLAYAMWYGNEVERGEMPTWVDFMKIYGDVLVPVSTDRGQGNMHELVKTHKKEIHTKPTRMGLLTVQPKCCAVCTSPADGCCDYCGGAYYCGGACQKTDWREHKQVCGDMSAMRLDEEDDEIKTDDECALEVDAAPLIGARVQRMRKKPRGAVMKTKERTKPPVKVKVPTKADFDVYAVVNSKAVSSEWGMHVLANLKQVIIISRVKLSRDALVGIAREIEQGLIDREPSYTKAFVESGVLIPTKEIDAVNPRHRARLDQSEELLAGILDAQGNVVGGMPWQRPYRTWPIMNFWRVYKATRARDRTPGQLHKDRSLRYRGMNALTLERDYSGANDAGGLGALIPFYLTEIQARDLGGVVKAGAAKISVSRWIPDRSVPEGAQQASQSAADSAGGALRGYARTFNVVRAVDVTGDAFDSKLREVLTILAKEDDRVTVVVQEGDEVTVDQAAQAISTAPTDPEVVNQSAQMLLNEIILADTDAPSIVWGVTVIPHYSGSRDEIRMPPLESYAEPLKVWRTVFHEITHWTNKKGRVMRKFSEEGHFTQASLTGAGARTLFQDTEMPPTGARAIEELIAEIGSYMLLAEAGMDTQPWASPMAKAYIRGWVKTLESPKRRFWLSKAANIASRAVDYLLRSRDGQMIDLFGDSDLDIEAQEAEEGEQHQKEEVDDDGPSS